MTNPKWQATLFFTFPITVAYAYGGSGVEVFKIVLYGLSVQEVENLKKFLGDSGGGLYEAISHYYKPASNVTYPENSYFIPAGKVMYATFKEYDHIDVA